MPASPFSSKPHDNLLRLGSNARKLTAHGQANGWEKVFSNQRLRSLSAFYLTQDQADRLSALNNLETLELFNGFLSDLSSLTRLNRLRHLQLRSTHYIKDFSFLGGLRKLHTLTVIDVPRFKDVGVLSQLPLLHTLRISSVFSQAPLPTLAAFARLTQVRVLRLGREAKDGSLSPLAKLANLRELGLPLTYQLKEYARLAVALPRVKCSCFTKPYGLARSPFFECKRCGGLERITLVKGYRALCPQCDSDKLRAYLKEFDVMKARYRRQAAAN